MGARETEISERLTESVDGDGALYDNHSGGAVSLHQLRTRKVTEPRRESPHHMSPVESWHLQANHNGHVCVCLIHMDTLASASVFALSLPPVGALPRQGCKRVRIGRATTLDT